jgi:hypothetical protein
VSQNFHRFQYEGSAESKYTAFAGLPLFFEMAQGCGLLDEIKNKLNLNKQGWLDSQIIQAILQLNFSGGDCLEDIDCLEADEGLKALLKQTEYLGMSRKERQVYRTRFRKGKDRALPSPSAIRRYLEKFHDEGEEEKRIKGQAFIPFSNKALKSLCKLNAVLVNFAQKHRPSEVATLDQDATLAETNKRQALYCYEKYKAYQPFNTYWYEQEMLLHSEFRDGNVNAGFDQLRLLKESLSLLPQGIKKVYVRSDSAGYQEDLLRYCAEGKDERFGVIEFAVASKVTQAFKAAVLQVAENDWQAIYKEDEKGNPIKTDQEWSEVGFVPNWAGKSKKSPDYRYIAMRERFVSQPMFPGFEPIQQELPFQTMVMRKSEYKLFGLVTNRTLPGNELINWLRKRCGASEKVHCVQKADLAGGQFPSNKFGANAAWWQMMVLAFNLVALMKKLVLPDSLKNKRMKGIRFHLINIAGCVVTHARRLIVKVSPHVDILGLIKSVRQKITGLATPSLRKVKTVT